MQTRQGYLIGAGRPDGSLSLEPRPVAPLRWWYRISAPPAISASASFSARERVRRGRLAALILLGLLVVVLASLPEVVLVPTLRPSIAIGAMCCLVAIPVNRLGYVSVAGVLLLVLLDLAIGGALLTAQGGLDPLYLPGFYLLVTTELIAVSLLPAATVFLVALAQSVFIALDVQLQIHTMMWDQMITTPGIFYSLIAGPIALQMIVALVSFLWVRSAQSALRRADRAEEIAFLEHREAERTRELEEGVQQLLAVHVQLANGDFSTRAPVVRNRALWQIANSLNNLIARLARFAQEASQAQYTLQRTQQDAQRVAEAIYVSGSGQLVSWPPPGGTPLDPVVEALRSNAMRGSGGFAGAIAVPAPLSGPYAAPAGGSPFASPFPAPFPSWASAGQAAPSGYSAPAAGQPSSGIGEAELPEWLRPVR